MAVRNVVLVHGAFADGSSWSKVIPLLLDKGYRVTSVAIPLGCRGAERHRQGHPDGGLQASQHTLWARTPWRSTRSVVR